MAINFWNTIWPVKTALPVNTGSAYTAPQLNLPLPNHILPPGATPSLPMPAIPAPIGNVKTLINNLPSIFNLTHGNF